MTRVLAGHTAVSCRAPPGPCVCQEGRPGSTPARGTERLAPRPSCRALWALAGPRGPASPPPPSPFSQRSESRPRPAGVQERVGPRPSRHMARALGGPRRAAPLTGCRARPCAVSRDSPLGAGGPGRCTVGARAHSGFGLPLQLPLSAHFWADVQRFETRAWEKTTRSMFICLFCQTS